MNVLSLFSGIGGLDLGLERAGMTIAGQVEIDPWCRKILAKHWPGVPRHDDVRTCVEWWGARPVDVVAGGFPCQPVSEAGLGQAQADSRWLWPAFADVVRDLRPRFVLVENVRGLLLRGRGMGDVLGDLAACGYDAEWDCVPASAFRAPHQRDRVWIVAYPARLRSGQPRLGTVDGGARSGGAERLGTLSSQAVADAESVSGELRAPASERPRRSASSGAAAMADADRQGQLQPQGRLGEVWRRPGYSGWWDAEPDVGRVAHGVPARVDRLRGLGNAVVPQVVEHIGRLILEAAAA